LTETTIKASPFNLASHKVS